jgi:hypothetical protein
MGYLSVGVVTHGALIGNLLVYFGVNVNKVIPLATPIHIEFKNDKFNLISTFSRWQVPCKHCRISSI